jgi:hypothetical protein
MYTPARLKSMCEQNCIHLVAVIIHLSKMQILVNWIDIEISYK